MFTSVKTLTTIILLALALASPARAAFSHAGFDAILGAVVSEGRVHYGKLRGLERELDAYLDQLAKADAGALESPAEIRAFWINAYNACVLKGVLNAFPVGRPTDVPGFFDAKRYKVMGRETTLNDLENEQLRKLGDPRVHFALVCAATSCPPLRDRSWSGETLSRDLDAATLAFLSDPARGATVAPDGSLHLSHMFRWYAKDFGGEKGVLEFVRQHGPRAISEAAAKKPAVKYLPYEWMLNATELRGAKPLKLW